ncbi:hypothetical protein AAZX31_04G009800 [Glycine max]|uniref:Knottin scorpion toxin-like domain-containing protein n=2 Tax=Glycine subgen. Soja TaxID=1462606 RepID=K7KHI1_SOYBN|nr:hypothetical protein JHK87_008583 [Glycine soja]KAG5047868.1 hypothetical protein JHK85_008971 [Glycine max]KAH1109222.1 hypothetical protein GYH30_008568 [Glycine max]KRH60800.1 hypothetical protein GLYMA_04G010100v4 [Glycine max]RZC14431.1 hypothetical protein D0Y65_008422 [Glycine soja]
MGMARFLNRIQVFAAFLATIVLVTSAFEGNEPRPRCWRNSKTWPHARCFHSSICSHHCQTSENAISGQCVFFFKKCKCKFCEEPL